MSRQLVLGIFLFVLRACPLPVLGQTPVSAADPASPEGAQETVRVILARVHSSARIESFRLAPELNFMNQDRPRFHSWPVLLQGHDMDSTQVKGLAWILERATADAPFRASDHCRFTPSTALRFHDRGTPLDMVISPDCTQWCFLAGEIVQGTYHPDAASVSDSLRVLIGGLFPHLQRAE
jgi:hypothetical protein